MNHSGHIESCHSPKHNIEWYCDRKNGEDYRYSYGFLLKVKKGDFIPCGTSGEDLFVPNSLGQISQKTDYLAMKKATTCCFVYGKSCIDEVLERRWTCCGFTKKCKLDEMGKYSCSK